MATKPKLRGFGIANYRSFDNDGFIVDDIKKINVFIGKNNSGKSNILRSVDLMSKIGRGKDLARSSEVDSHNQDGEPPCATVVVPSESVLHGANIEPQCREELGPRVKIRWNTGTGEFQGSNLFDVLNPRALNELSRVIATSHFRGIPQNKDEFVPVLSGPLMQRAVVAAREFDRLIHIPSFREIRKEQGVGGVFNGHNVIAQLREMQNPPEGRDEDQETFGRIQQLVGDLIGVQAPNMEIRPSEDKILLRIYGNRLPLDSYGTGIHQLVILCAALAMYDNHVICIEEPEIHIHPELQRKFLQFISTKTTNRYFITTHSNVFLDFLPDINVYHVTHDGQKTTVTRTDASPQARNVLTDLGYKASDLLQANGIIWVEGPSDRIYLNKWIDLQDLEFVEGIHYAIMFYGGRLLAHISGKDDPADDLVELLRINSNALIVMDRDGGFSGARLSGTKKRIIKEFGKDNCWVTKGREIENYLSPELIDRYLSQCYETQIETSFGPDDHLLESIEAAAKGMKGAKIRPATSKVGLARELCELMAESDLEVLDLRKRLDKICKLIKVWNHMCG